MRSWFTSAPSLRAWAPRIQVTVSAIWKRLIVVSRGLKLLRPKVSTRCAPWLTTVSGSALLAWPGSWSFAYWRRTSLKKVGRKTELREALTVRVWTSASPVCSSAFVTPLFSLLPPVKFWWL